MRKMKGFTIIELMIVVSIVGILAAIILPILSGHAPMLGTGTVCRAGVLINVDVNGYESQLFGPDGLPISCR